MSNLDLDTTYRAILSAARARRYITYKEIADANNVEWDQVFRSIRFHLDDLVVLADSHGWPLFTAIVVRQENVQSGILRGDALAGFIKPAKRLGYDVTEQEKFAKEQQEMTFNWAPYVPDRLFIAAGAATSRRGRAPKWLRKELILILDLYLKNKEAPNSIPNETLLQYSKICRKLHPAIFSKDDKFRSPGSMSRRVMNYRSCDPYWIKQGVVGLKSGTKGEFRDIWSELTGYPDYVAKIADKIMNDVQKINNGSPASEPVRRAQSSKGEKDAKTAVALEEWFFANFKIPEISDSEVKKSGFSGAFSRAFARSAWYERDGRKVQLYDPYQAITRNLGDIYTSDFLELLDKKITEETGVKLWERRGEIDPSYIDGLQKNTGKTKISASDAKKNVEYNIKNTENVLESAGTKMGHNNPPEQIDDENTVIIKEGAIFVEKTNKIMDEINKPTPSEEVLKESNSGLAFLYKRLGSLADDLQKYGIKYGTKYAMQTIMRTGVVTAPAYIVFGDSIVTAIIAIMAALTGLINAVTDFINSIKK